jgi:hypothetical protein
MYLNILLKYVKKKIDDKIIYLWYKYIYNNNNNTKISSKIQI